MTEKKKSKRHELLINLAFDPNRLEEQSLIAAYELILPNSSKLARQPPKVAKRKDRLQQQQLGIAL